MKKKKKEEEEKYLKLCLLPVKDLKAILTGIDNKMFDHLINCLQIIVNFYELNLFLLCTLVHDQLTSVELYRY